MHARDALHRIVYVDTRHHLDMSTMALRDRSRESELKARSWYLAALRIHTRNSHLWSDRKMLRSDGLISVIDRDDNKIFFMQGDTSRIYMKLFSPHMSSSTTDKIRKKIKKFFLIPYDLSS